MGPVRQLERFQRGSLLQQKKYTRPGKAYPPNYQIEALYVYQLTEAQGKGCLAGD
jgi:hypothetical protein